MSGHVSATALGSQLVHMSTGLGGGGGTPVAGVTSVVVVVVRSVTEGSGWSSHQGGRWVVDGVEDVHPRGLPAPMLG